MQMPPGSPAASCFTVSAAERYLFAPPPPPNSQRLRWLSSSKSRVRNSTVPAANDAWQSLNCTPQLIPAGLLVTCARASTICTLSVPPPTTAWMVLLHELQPSLSHARTRYRCLLPGLRFECVKLVTFAPSVEVVKLPPTGRWASSNFDSPGVVSLHLT